jgi:hypothetical protein
MLELGLALPDEGTGTVAHIANVDEAAWRVRRIVTARHCLGCTAGAGSSCGGQTA